MTLIASSYFGQTPHHVRVSGSIFAGALHSLDTSQASCNLMHAAMGSGHKLHALITMFPLPTLPIPTMFRNEYLLGLQPDTHNIDESVSSS